MVFTQFEERSLAVLSQPWPNPTGPGRRLAHGTYDPVSDTAYWADAAYERELVPSRSDNQWVTWPPQYVDAFKGVTVGGPWGTTQILDYTGVRHKPIMLFVFLREGLINVTVHLCGDIVEILGDEGATNERQYWHAAPATVRNYRFNPDGTYVGVHSGAAALQFNAGLGYSGTIKVVDPQEDGTVNLAYMQTWREERFDGVTQGDTAYVHTVLTYGPASWLPSVAGTRALPDGYDPANGLNPFYYYGETSTGIGIGFDRYDPADPWSGVSESLPDGASAQLVDRLDSTELFLSLSGDRYAAMSVTAYPGAPYFGVFSEDAQSSTKRYDMLLFTTGAPPPQLSLPYWDGQLGDWVPGYGYPPGQSSFPIAYPDLVDDRVVIVNPEDPTDPWVWGDLPPGADPNGFLAWWFDNGYFRVSYDGTMVLAWLIPPDLYAQLVAGGAVTGYYNTQSKVWQTEPPPAGEQPAQWQQFPWTGSYVVDTLRWESETGDNLTEHGVRWRGFDILLFGDRAEGGELFQDKYILSAQRAYLFGRKAAPFIVDADEAAQIYEAGFGWALYPEEDEA